MKYRVMIAGYAGMPATELSAHRWQWMARLVVLIFNIANLPHLFAFLEEAE